MLRLSPSRKARTGGFKVKHAGQICLLLTVFLWLLYQVRHSYYKNMEHKEPSPELLLSDSIETREVVIKLGRKDLFKPLNDGSLVKRGQDKEEELGEDRRDVKVEGEEEEEGNVVEGRGGGDDEIDVNDQERAEEEDSESELEDLIDEEDREKEDATNEEEVTSHSGRAKDSHGSMEVKEEDENDTHDSTMKLVKTRGLGSDNGEDVSNREDPLFFRDRLVDQIENSDGDTRAKKFSSRSILLDDMDDKMHLQVTDS